VNKMTTKQIEEQIADIRAVTARAMVSPEAAATFLREAGIFLEPINKSAKSNQAQQKPLASSTKKS
jgi:hypothetical protein